MNGLKSLESGVKTLRDKIKIMMLKFADDIIISEETENKCKKVLYSINSL